jgi:molybdopterin molybdotransferase
MISVNEAYQLIQANTPKGSTINLDLYEAFGYAVANNIFSSIDFPSFKQSAMDGYAFRFDDWNNENNLIVEQEIQAGNENEILACKKGEAIRIFTGAKVPDKTDTVVMQEHTSRIENTITITNHQLIKGSNIRPIASQTKKGDLILTQGSVITPAVAGLLAGIGISQVEVYTKPKCIILNTGKELIKPGQAIHGGQIYESNSYALTLGLKQVNIDVDEVIQVDDDEAQIKHSIQEALERADILLITGGISVGDYDYVSEALDKNGVVRIFHHVKQKPGKPLYFGKKVSDSSEKLDKIIFGLPGNPGSVLTCFYEYVVPCLRMMMGYLNPEQLSVQLPMLNPYDKKPGLTHFLKGKIHHNGVEVLDHQESYKMNAFAIADCLVIINEETESIKESELVTIRFLKF